MKTQDKIESILKKDPGFRIPEDYFDGLSAKILDKINSPEINKPKTIILNRRFLVYAASFIGFMFILYTGYNYFYKNTYKITPDELTTYIESNSYSFNENEITDLIDYEYTTIEDSAVKLNSDDVIEYLLAEEIDYYTIINEMY